MGKGRFVVAVKDKRSMTVVEGRWTGKVQQGRILKRFKKEEFARRDISCLALGARLPLNEIGIFVNGEMMA